MKHDVTGGHEVPATAPAPFAIGEELRQTVVSLARHPPWKVPIAVAIKNLFHNAKVIQKSEV